MGHPADRLTEITSESFPNRSLLSNINKCSEHVSFFVFLVSLKIHNKIL